MVSESYELVLREQVDPYLAGFVFFSTISSYNFYWYLTSHSTLQSFRLTWTMSHRNYHLAFTGAGALASLFFFFHLPEHRVWLGLGAALSLIYMAPKIPHPSFSWLKKFATGKSILLALVWTYATVVLPVIIEKGWLSQKVILFICGRFFFIYTLCVLFDYRDREDDRTEGIRSMIISMSEKGIDRLFLFSWILSVLFYLTLYDTGMTVYNIVILLIPPLVLLFLYRKAKKNFSDYLYYFILDGLMMLSGLIWWMVSLF